MELCATHQAGSTGSHQAAFSREGAFRLCILHALLCNHCYTSMIKYFCIHTLWFVFIFTVIKTNTIVLNHKLIAVFCTQAYGAQFVQKVHHRHVLAKNYFSHVPGMMDKMQEKVLDMPLPRP